MLTPQQKNSMTNEKEWWEERTRKLFHGVWGASPWNEERMTDAAIDVLRDIVAEAERRGERKALEWLRDNASGGGDWRMKIEIKLASLKNL